MVRNFREMIDEADHDDGPRCLPGEISPHYDLIWKVKWVLRSEVSEVKWVKSLD